VVVVDMGRLDDRDRLGWGSTGFIFGLPFRALSSVPSSIPFIISQQVEDIVEFIFNGSFVKSLEAIGLGFGLGA